MDQRRRLVVRERLRFLFFVLRRIVFLLRGRRRVWRRQLTRGS
ncbi:hypothetical protein OG756_21145 [Streptomyces sp. NBC_01310]|nr:hypothetical protein OG756_21145 [Streptomyces sp. NBC_01310]